jgi:predicted metal-binding membrane protein
MTSRVSLSQCQRKLLITWLIGLAPAVLIMSIRSLTGSFSGKEQEIWAWFVPMFLPTLTLMIGAYSSIALQEQADSKTVDKSFFYISLGCSIFYLLILSSVVIYQPFADAPALETLSRSSFFLSVIQGIVTGCLGIFFVSQKQRANDRPSN